MQIRSGLGLLLAVGGLTASCGGDDPPPGRQPPIIAGNSSSAAGSGTAIAGTGLIAGGSAGVTSPGPVVGNPGGVTPGTGGRPSLPGRAGATAPPPPPPVAGTAGPGGAAGGGGSPMTAPPTPAGPPGTWPAADPAKTGPFMTVTENNVGPDMMFTMFRPKDLTQRHPVITWGNGTGTTPPTYRSLLNLYASHGFIVIASNSMNVAQGDPPPMLAGVTWVIEQDKVMGSPLFGHVDADRIGATGHSQGAFATSRAGTDARIKTIAPIESLGGGRGLHGPVLALCGSMDTTVPCSGNLSGYNAVSDQPAMYAEETMADHTNWIFSAMGSHPYWIITNAWFRVHLMDDKALRPMFYGPDCGVCKDTATWKIMRKMMDN